MILQATVTKYIPTNAYIYAGVYDEARLPHRPRRTGG